MVTQSGSSMRAVAPVVGFLLIVAILMIAATQYQANVVPAQEIEEEIDHFGEVSQDMAGLRSEILRSSSTGQLQTQEVQTGVSYGVPGLTNPPTRGTIAYSPAQEDIEIRNAENTREASNFWRGDVDRTYETGFLEYSINYNRLNEHNDLFIEHGLLYGEMERAGENNYIQQSAQPIVSGRNINIYTIQGDIAVSSAGTTTVETNPVSAPMESVAVRNFEEQEPIELRIPTRVPADVWREQFLAEEYDPDNEEDDAFIDNIEETADGDAILIEMTPEETYNLRMSRIDLTTQGQQTRIDETDPEYLAVETQAVNIRERSSVTLRAQVRDKYNNGVIGVPVYSEAADSSGSCYGDFTDHSSDEPTSCSNGDPTYLQPGSDISDETGDVTFVYESPEAETDRDVTFSFRMEDEE